MLSPLLHCWSTYWARENERVRDQKGGSLRAVERGREEMSLFAEYQTNVLPWYAIQVRSKCETAVAQALRGKGYEEFLPSYRSSRRWSDRLVDVRLPLFPGYLFCRLNVSERLLPVLTTPGFVTIVGAGKSPIPIPDEEISTIRLVIESGLPAQPGPFLAVGCYARIERGPLAGVEGIVINANKKSKLILSVPLLQRSVAVEVSRDDIRPIPERKPLQATPDFWSQGREITAA